MQHPFKSEGPYWQKLANVYNLRLPNFLSIKVIHWYCDFWMQSSTGLIWKKPFLQLDRPQFKYLLLNSLCSNPLNSWVPLWTGKHDMPPYRIVATIKRCQILITKESAKSLPFVMIIGSKFLGLNYSEYINKSLFRNMGN